MEQTRSGNVTVRELVERRENLPDGRRDRSSRSVLFLKFPADERQPKEDSQVETPGSAGKGKKSVTTTADDEDSQLQATSGKAVDLPDEIWALILSKLEDGWYHAHRLARVSHQFARVLADWKHMFCREVTFNFATRSQKQFDELGRRCGKHVQELRLQGKHVVLRSGLSDAHPLVRNLFDHAPALQTLRNREDRRGPTTLADYYMTAR